ncbi:MAG: SEC-C metal-binding domain-containing protein, partial [Chloroflexota bacterium]|nr:SEC-C metal-binding domain-containing protein [Chloroflexota bacterium]
PRETIADAAHALLVDLRAATSEELAEPIAAAGLTRAKSPTRAVSRALGDDPRFRRLSDRRWAVPRELLDGAVLTHRPTPQEIDNAALSVVPDLAPLVVAGLFGIMTVDGALLTPAWDAEAGALTGTDTDTAIKGPPGWLAGADGKTLLHVRLVGGTLEAAWGPEPPAATRMSGRRIVETVRRALDRQPPTESFFGLPPTVPLSEALLLMVIDDPELLREPLLPLGTLFEEAGLETHQGWVGYPGTDWELLDEFMDFDDDWGDEDVDDLPGFGGERWSGDDPLSDLDAEVVDDEDAALTAQLAETFGLGEEGVRELQVVMGAYELSRRGQGLEDPQMLVGLAALMADPTIAHLLAIFAGTDADLEPFVLAIEKAANEVDAAGPRYVLAASAEARDDVIEAERQLRAALAADPGFFPAALELARFETDRARYGEALQLLIRVGVEADDPERTWLEDVNQSALPKVGRNEPCPCGSGRKYKVCHLGREGDVGTVDSGKALVHKLWLWLDRPRGRRLIHDLVVEVVPDSERPEDDDEERDRLEGPILDDVILY